MIIENFKRIDKGHLLGVADILIPKWHLTIKGVTVFQKGGGRWCKLPQRQFEKSDGSTGYASSVEWTDKAVEGRFRDAVIDALVDAGYLGPATTPPPAERPNRKNPKRMEYCGWDTRPADHPTPTSDDLPW